MRSRSLWVVATLVVVSAVSFTALVLAGPIAGRVIGQSSIQGLLGGLAFGSSALAIAVALRARGRRADVNLGIAIGASVAIGVMTSPAVRAELQAIGVLPSRYLPERVTLAAVDGGIEVWGSPGKTRYVVIPWDQIVEIRPGIGQAMLGPLAGLCVETSAGSVCFPLAGKGTVGIGPVDAPELAEKLEALRRGARNKIN